MSDRELMIDEAGLELFMDGESGTYRLFNAEDDGKCIDFTLKQIQVLSSLFPGVALKIQEDPKRYNAEIRRRWFLEDAP